MELILDEAEDDSSTLRFSDEDEEEVSNDISNFIDDSSITEEGISFYRKRERDPQNLDGYPKFYGQTRNSIEAIYSVLKVILVKMINRNLLLQKIGRL